MQVPAPPRDEAPRLDALRTLGLLDTAREERFDRYVRLARALAEVPIAAISLIDANRQWFKGCEGLSVSETGRDVSFCGHAILERGVFYIGDASADPRFADNPLVTGEPHIRFYAGFPIYLPGGHAMGTLCVIDRVPRCLEPSRLLRLRDLADMLQRELALHLLLQDVRQSSDSRLLGSPAYIALSGLL